MKICKQTVLRIPKSDNSRPRVVAFDVVETLFALDPMRQRLSDLGLSEEALELFFARLLRNGFALDASGTFTPFGDVARATLEGMLAARGIELKNTATTRIPYLPFDLDP